MKYQFIEQHKQEFPIVVMCQVLVVGDKWLLRLAQASDLSGHREDAQITQEIRQVFNTHQSRYGSPRIHKELRDQGRVISRKRVARLMREAALSARRKRRRVMTTKRDKTHPVASNLENARIYRFSAEYQMGD